MKVIEIFDIEYNAPEAIRQEFDHAREHYREISSRWHGFNPGAKERYYAARDRLNRAKEMMLAAGLEW